MQDLHKRYGAIVWGPLKDGFPFDGERVSLSTKLLDENDGPMLQLLKDCAGEKIHLPKRYRDYPAH